MFQIKENKIHMIVEDKQVGYIIYDDKTDHIIGSYIFVEPEERGKGYASELIDYFVGFAKEQNKKIKPICPVIKRAVETGYSEMIY